MKLKTLEVAGFSAALHGMRNPKNSWLKSDSTVVYSKLPAIGPADLKLAQSLIAGGPVHSKFLRQIMVWVDITAPVYWWSEFDTYKVGVVRDSCSTMHTLVNTIQSLSGDESVVSWISNGGVVPDSVLSLFEVDKSDLETKAIIGDVFKELYRISLNTEIDASYRLRTLKKLLPSSWLQLSTITMSYQNIRSMLIDRHNHRLSEWNTDFVNWAHTLPYAEEFLFYKIKEAVQ